MSDTRVLESSHTQIQPIRSIVRDFSDALPSELRKSTDKEAIQIVKPDKDTTYFGFIFKEGIMLASYSHMTEGTSLASTIMEINPYMLCTMVGEPVDTLFWTQCMEHESQNNRRMPAQLASEHLEIILSSCSDATSALIASWEPQMGPFLFLVDNCDEGCLSSCRFWIRCELSSIYDACDIRNRYDMSICEAASFARWAIHLAAFEDGARDGLESVYYVGPNGWKKMFGDDVVKRYVCRPVTNTADQKLAQEEMVDQEMPTRY